MASSRKHESIHSICWAYFPLQLRNLDNNTFSMRKSYQCIPAETLENLCAERKMAEYRQKIKTAYIKTATAEWSNINRKRKLKWFGKVIRAEEPTPVKRAFNYSNAPCQWPRGKPTSTWLSIIKSDFRDLNLTCDEAINSAIDIKTGETIVNDS